MTQKILLVDDEPLITDINSRYLEREGYETHVSNSGVEALAWVEQHPVDLIATDIMMPKMDGYDFINDVLTKKPDIPFLFFTAKTSDQDKIYSLSLGADDYIVKPFSPRELVLRINNILRRVNKGNADSVESVLIGDLTIDYAARTAAINGHKLALTVKEFDLLWVLSRNPDRVFSKSELYGLVWDENQMLDTNTINVHIHGLRHQLDQFRTEKTPILRTVWGVGYRLEEMH